MKTNNVLNFPGRSGSKSARTLHVVVDFPWDARACMGTGAYSETIVRALAEASPGSTFTLIVGEEGRRPIDLANVRYASLPPVEAREEGARQVALPAFLARSEADCLFAPATLLPLAKLCPMVATIHDLLYLRKPEFYAPGLVKHLERWLDPSLRSADRLVAISDSARRDLLDLKKIPEDRIAVIPQPVREDFRTRLTTSEVKDRLQSLGLEAPFFFHVSNLSPHKNVSFALQVFADFLSARPGSQSLFVYAGGGVAPNRPPDLESVAHSLGIADRVRYVGRVGDDDLRALYQGCNAFLFPSLAEGWGLPVAEATSMGARVISSPHVPAASSDQARDLDRKIWLEAALDDQAGRKGLPPVDPEEAGRKLFDVISQAAESRQRTSSLPRTRREPPAPAVAPPPGAVRPVGISGCTILRNGAKLRYPFLESVASYAPLCDEVVICWDPNSDDDTASLVRKASERFPNVRLVESSWDLTNRKEGSELARQTQIAFGHCRHEWTLYVQADEALHERDYDQLRRCASERRLAAVAFRRESFFGSLDREIPEHRTSGMIRMFRTGHGRSVGDAMYVHVEGHPGAVASSEATLYNYSRLGSASDIVERCTNLHRFYHDDRWLSDRKPDQELDLRTVPYVGSHPAPIEASFRVQTGRSPRLAAPKVSVHMIAREQDAFGADLLTSALDALAGYADQIVIVDNGLGEEARQAVADRTGPLPITLVEARGVRDDFAKLRNLAIAATAPAMTHIHKSDSDEVYAPGSLAATKELLQDSGVGRVGAALVHFMIEPTLVESVQRKEVVFRKDEALSWEGAVHERMARDGGGRALDGPAFFLHFGYCRPQWQTLLKWLRYALLQGGTLAHYQYEFVDGVRRPWFRDGRTPDTILEARRPHLQPFKHPYPPSVRPWLEAFARSGRTWRDWVGGRAGSGLWQRWQELCRTKGTWEETLEDILSTWTSAESLPTGSRRVLPSPSLSRSTSTGVDQEGSWKAPGSASAGPAPVPTSAKNEFRRGFSIIIPSWNNCVYLKKAIENIRAHSDFDHEILVHVNDGSDGTLEWVRSQGIRHTYTPENVGICVAMNRITDLCTRDLVMYFNDDMVALPEWDRHLVEYAEAHDVGKLLWLSSTLIEPTGDNPSFIAPADYGTDVDRFDEARLLADLPGLRLRKPDVVGTSWAPNLLYKETFDQVGRMSEEFSPGFGSDPDLAKKLWDLGMRHFVGVGKSLVYHFQCKGTSKIPKHLHNDAQGTFFRKHRMSIHDFIFEVLRPGAERPPKRSAGVGHLVGGNAR
jgi:glycosyltransferase involved in cell wall biosynthesis/GT2 family glycosyltransferase